MFAKSTFISTGPQGLSLVVPPAAHRAPGPPPTLAALKARGDCPAAIAGSALAAGNESQDEEKDARECPSDGAPVAEDPTHRNKVDNSFTSNARKCFKSVAAQLFFSCFS